MTNPDELERAVERLEADMTANHAMTLGGAVVRTADLRLILAANRKMRAALEAFAGLELPRRRGGNAGFYLIRFADVERARSALSTKED